MTILDDDKPTLAVNDVAKAEGNSGTTAFTFTLTLSGTYRTAVSGTYATAAGTATETLDYQPVSGSFSIPAGSTSTTVTVQVNGELLPEGNETFSVNLTETANAIAASGNDLTGLGTIQNDDLADIKLTKTVSAGTPNPAPTGAPLTYLLKVENLSASAAAGVSVLDTLPPGTTFESASAGCAYDSTAHTATCSYGTVGSAEVVKSIVVVPTTAGPKLNAALAASTSPETDMTNNASQAAIDVQAPGSFRFSSSAYAVEEGASRVVTVERTGGAGGAATVDYSTAPASAQANDFTDNDGTLTFGPGETAKTFTVRYPGGRPRRARRDGWPLAGESDRRRQPRRAGKRRPDHRGRRRDRGARPRG